MIAYLSNKQQIILQEFNEKDLGKLITFFQGLSFETIAQFHIHKLDLNSIINFYRKNRKLTVYVAFETQYDSIIGYCIANNLSSKIGISTLSTGEISCFFEFLIADDWTNCDLKSQISCYAQDQILK